MRGVLATLVLVLSALPALYACGSTASSGQSASPSPNPTSSPSPNPIPSPSPSPATQQQGYSSVRTVTVQARADVLGREIAHISINAYVQAGDVHSALNRAQDVIQSIRTVVDELDIATQVHDENISSYAGGPGYPASANRSISVETPNSTTLSDTIGKLDERIRGAILQPNENLFFNTSFSIEEGGSADDEARTKAIADAREAAQQIASENGLTLGEILSVVEGQQVQLSLSPVPNAPAPAGGGGGYYPGQQAEQIVTVTVTFAVR